MNGNLGHMIGVLAVMVIVGAAGDASAMVSSCPADGVGRLAYCEGQNTVSCSEWGCGRGYWLFVGTEGVTVTPLPPFGQAGLGVAGNTQWDSEGTKTSDEWGAYACAGFCYWVLWSDGHWTYAGAMWAPIGLPVDNPGAIDIGAAFGHLQKGGCVKEQAAQDPATVTESGELEVHINGLRAPGPGGEAEYNFGIKATSFGIEVSLGEGFFTHALDSRGVAVSVPGGGIEVRFQDNTGEDPATVTVTPLPSGGFTMVWVIDGVSYPWTVVPC